MRYLARYQNGHPVGQVADFIHVVRGEQYGGAAVAQVAEHLPSFPAGFGGKSCGGFVQEQQFRVADQAEGQIQLALLSA